MELKKVDVPFNGMPMEPWFVSLAYAINELIDRVEALEAHANPLDAEITNAKDQDGDGE